MFITRSVLILVSFSSQVSLITLKLYLSCINNVSVQSPDYAIIVENFMI